MAFTKGGGERAQVMKIGKLFLKTSIFGMDAVKELQHYSSLTYGPRIAYYLCFQHFLESRKVFIVHVTHVKVLTAFLAHTARSLVRTSRVI